MHAVNLYEGDHYTVKALESESGKCYFREFYENTLEETQKKKVIKLIQFFADRKSIRNETKFRKLKGGGKIFELKPHPARLLGFYNGEGVFIITHGFKKGKPIKQEKSKTQNRKRRFLNQE